MNKNRVFFKRLDRKVSSTFLKRDSLKRGARDGAERANSRSPSKDKLLSVTAVSLRATEMFAMLLQSVQRRTNHNAAFRGFY